MIYLSFLNYSSAFGTIAALFEPITAGFFFFVEISKALVFEGQVGHQVPALRGPSSECRPSVVTIKAVSPSSIMVAALKGVEAEIEALRSKREMLELDSASYSNSTLAKVRMNTVSVDNRVAFHGPADESR